MTQFSLTQSASPHPAQDRVFKSPDTQPCATPPEKVLIRRRIPCSEDAATGAQVAPENAEIPRSRRVRRHNPYGTPVQSEVLRSFELATGRKSGACGPFRWPHLLEKPVRVAGTVR